MEIEKVNKIKNITSTLVPNEKFFTDVSLSLKERGDERRIEHVRSKCASKIRIAYSRFVVRLAEVEDAFLHISQIGGPFDNIHDYYHAVRVVMYASSKILDISEKYEDLLYNKTDCDSLDKCKSLKATALASMLTAARRCMPSFAYLDKVRYYFANVDQYDEVAANAFLNNKYGFVVLAPPHATFPLLLQDNIKIDPQALAWVQGLDTGHHGVMLKGCSTTQVDVASRNPQLLSLL